MLINTVDQQMAPRNASTSPSAYTARDAETSAKTLISRTNTPDKEPPKPIIRDWASI